MVFTKPNSMQRTRDADRTGGVSRFLRDDKGAVTVEFVVLVPMFVLLLVFFADASIIYLTHTEMYNAARDTARRMSTHELTTEEEATNYAAGRLNLGERTYIVDPRFGSTVSVTIAIGLYDAAIFGAWFKPILGRALVARATVQRETALMAAG